MKLNFQYIDNEIILNEDQIVVIEIENKTYFYRMINDLNLLSLGSLSDDVSAFNIDNKSINLLNKVELYIDYFNIDLNCKKNLNSLYKMLNANINDDNKSQIIKSYLKIQNILTRSFLDFNLPLVANAEFELENLFKLLKVNICESTNLLNSLLLIIDINNMFKCNEFLVFVNLKQYLNKDELYEFYKYSIYSNVKLLLIDSQCYGVTNDFERKLIIDRNLDEFLL